MRIVQLILSLCVLAVLIFNLYMQRATFRWETVRWQAVNCGVVALTQRLDALEQDDCSQVPVEQEMRSKL